VHAYCEVLHLQHESKGEGANRQLIEASARVKAETHLLRLGQRLPQRHHTFTRPPSGSTKPIPIPRAALHFPPRSHTLVLFATKSHATVLVPTPSRATVLVPTPLPLRQYINLTCLRPSGTAIMCKFIESEQKSRSGRISPGRSHTISVATPRT
jgi:hypothetical protein